MSYTPSNRATITLNVDGAESSQREIETVSDAMRRLNGSSLQGIEGQINGFNSRLGGLKSTLIGFATAAAGAFAVDAFTNMIRGAIDATDAADDLSQKTGIAVEKLAGLELAFQKGGMESSALGSSMARLSANIVNGNETFERLKISSKNLDGTLKSNTEMLYEVADGFASMENGAAKSALATQLFGKSGADMIPMLNEGSAGLREMDEMARKLGLSLDRDAVDAAGNFNDTLDVVKLAGKGVAQTMANELLPTLSTLAGQFLDTMLAGNRLENTAAAIGTGLKALYITGVAVVEVFSTVGKTLGAAGAQAVALLQGNFQQAAEIGRMWKADISADWSAAAKTITEAWEGTGSTSIDTMAALLKKNKQLAASASELAAKTKAAAAEQKDQAATLAELAGLTSSFSGEWEKLSKLYGKGLISTEQLTKAQADLLAKQPAIKAAADGEIKSREQLEAFNKQYAAALSMVSDQMGESLDAAVKEAEQQELLANTYGRTASEIAALELARLEGQLSQRVSNGLSLTEIDILEKLINAKKRTAVATRTMGDVDAAKKAQEEWKQAADSIEQSLGDALMRGFESGSGFAKNFVATMKNMFSTMVLRPVISAVVSPVAGAFTGALGLAGTAQAATGGGGGAASSVGSLGLSAVSTTMGSYFGAGGLAGSMAAGAGWLTGATTLGGSLAAAGSLAATGTLGGIASSIGMVAGALGPIALGIGAAVAIWKKLDTSGTKHTGGAAESSSAGTSAITALSLNMADIRTSSDSQKMVEGLTQGIVGILDNTALAFGKTAGYTAATAFADDTSKDGAWGSLMIKKMGQTVVNWQDTRGGTKWAPKTFADGEKGQEQYLAALTSSVRGALDSIGLPDWARSMLNGVASDTSLDNLAKVVEQINVTQAALGAMRSQLVGFSSLSDATVSSLMAAAGGIDKLFSNASTYYDAFYTEAEKNATVSKQIADSLSAVNLQMPTSGKAFRDLVEAQMKLGPQGAESVAVLLSVAGAFAQVSPVVKDLGMSLEEIANQRGTLQEQLDKLTMTREQLLARERVALDESNRPMWDRIQTLNAEKDASVAAQAAAEATAQERTTLQEQLDQLTMTREQLLARERAALDEGNRPLWDRIQALQAEKDATLLARDVAAGLMSDVDTAFSVLQRSIDRERDAIQKQVATHTEAANRIRSVTDSLRSTINGMRGPGAEVMERTRAQSDLQGFLAIARAGGMLPDSDKLQSVLSVLTQDASAQFASFADYQADFYATKNTMADLASISDAALSVEERTLKSLESQLSSYEQMLEREQEQIDQLKGISTTELSIHQAILALHSSVLAAASNPVNSSMGAISQAYQSTLGRAPDAAGMQYWNDRAAAGSTISDIVGAISNSSEAKIKALYQSTFGRPADAGGLKYWMERVAAGTSYGTIEQGLKESNEYKAKTKVPGYAAGGDHGGGWRIVGENGPELEATGAARIFNASQTRDLMSRFSSPVDNSAALVGEIKALRDEVAALRRENSQENYAIARNTMDTASSLEDSMRGSIPFAVKIVQE